MICPTPTDSTSRTIPKTFTNWARALTFTAAKSFCPSTRGEIVEIIRQAEVDGQRVKWTGSVWAFMGLYVSNDVVIESDAITGVIDRTLILNQLTLADESLRESLVQIKGGTKVFNVSRLLLGGSGGQSRPGRRSAARQIDGTFPLSSLLGRIYRPRCCRVTRPYRVLEPDESRRAKRLTK